MNVEQFNTPFSIIYYTDLAPLHQPAKTAQIGVIKISNLRDEKETKATFSAEFKFLDFFHQCWKFFKRFYKQCSLKDFDFSFLKKLISKNCENLSIFKQPATWYA